MLRTVAGIVVGYLIFAVPAFLLFLLTHHDPHAPASMTFEVFAVVYGVFFALLGGYLGTAVSGRRAPVVCFAIAGIMAGGALSSLIAKGISWSPIFALLCMVPATVIGGWLCIRQKSVG